MVYDLIVAGGGAAGFYGAIQAAELRTAASILIIEKTTKLLTKVKVSGGGRCNVTHDCPETKKLASHYPRGGKFLRQLFKAHSATDVVAWFEKKEVPLKVESDGRMFPTSDDSQTVIDCFLRLVDLYQIQIKMGDGVIEVQRSNESLQISTQQGKVYHTRNLLIATGGSSQQSGYDWIHKLGHNISKPLPSLFTFNDSEKRFVDLMGVAVPFAEVKIAGTKFMNAGPVLITHWGLSGPGVIRLSAWAAEYLHSIRYEFTALVSWIGPAKEEEVRNELNTQKHSHGKKRIITNPMFGLPLRLWTKLCHLAEVSEEKIWSELPQKNLNKLLEFIIRCPFNIKGKTTFKEEFVTCGGVDLKEIDVERMESKVVKGIFFAGEVLNIDGETGGFNFQAAWSTAWVAAKHLYVKK